MKSCDTENLVPVEGGNEEHLTRAQDAMFHSGIFEKGKSFMVWWVKVDLQRRDIQDIMWTDQEDWVGFSPPDFE